MIADPHWIIKVKKLNNQRLFSFRFGLQSICIGFVIIEKDQLEY